LARASKCVQDVFTVHPRQPVHESSHWPQAENDGVPVHAPDAVWRAHPGHWPQEVRSAHVFVVVPVHTLMPPSIGVPVCASGAGIAPPDGPASRPVVLEPASSAARPGALARTPLEGENSDSES
jgi:hypothetical protein